MPFVRRAMPLVVMLSLFLASLPTRALAVTTQQEIRAGQAEDEDITRSQVMETDPLLNAYVQSIANKLWMQVARKDLPYNIKVIKAPDINSFATEGGFVYIDEGLIDFVQSDDEFAGVIGHETGHIERRHVVTMNSKAEILEALTALASILSPFFYVGGSWLDYTLMMKVSREDEIEADRYGLQLMSRAGYDPEAMVTMMKHMNVLEGDNDELVDKYLEDHPDPDVRVSRFLGYPELDPTVVTQQELLARADSDAERARYSYASIALQNILRRDPHNVDALIRLSQMQLALGLTNKSAQTLAEVSQLGSPQARALVAMRETQLQELQERNAQALDLDPDFGRLIARVRDAHDTLIAEAQQLQPLIDQAKERLQSIQSRLKDISDEVPDFGNISVKPNSRIASVMGNMEAIARAVNSASDDDAQVILNVGTAEGDKESGLLLNEREILEEMADPLGMHPMPAESLVLLPSYSSMLRDMSYAQEDATRAVDEARASLALMDQAIGELDESLRALDSAEVFSGDLNESDFNVLQPHMAQTMQDFNDAAITASQAAQLYNMARARQLSIRITLLGLGSSPQRYATLQYALQQRFGMDGVDYHTMVRDGITPGDVTAATILAADVQSTPQAVIDESLRTKTPIVDLANEHGMHAWPLEIFMNLVYLDYTDDPVKEMTVGAPAGAGGDD